MYNKILEASGLTPKQAQIYVASLELGSATTGQIAKKCGLKRTTAYGIIDELAGQGLLNINPKGKANIITASEPQVLLDILESKKKSLATVIPDLAALHGTYTVRPRLQFFEGKEGIKRIYEDTLHCRSKKLYQAVRVTDFINFPGGEFSKDYIAKRAAKNIVAYALHPKSDDVHNTTYGTESERWKRHVRYLPPSMFYASMIMLYDYKVAMISTQAENFGFIIESKEFSNTLKAWFDFMWRIGSKEPES